MVILDARNISLARQRMGLSVEEFAQACATTDRTVRSWCNGAGAPSSRLEQLAQVTQMPSSFFTRQIAEEPDIAHVFFRTRRRTSTGLLRQATAFGALGVELYRDIAELFHLPPLSLDFADAGTSPQDAADYLRRSWNLADQPVPNLVQLSEAHGIRVLGMPREIEDVDAFSFWSSDGRPYVFLSRQKTAERSRFDLAHELGHLILHGGSCSSESTDQMLESQANSFAAAFLMPPSAILALTDFSPSLDHILLLKQHFGTSAMSMARAVWEAGRLSDWKFRSIRTSLIGRGFSTGEPDSNLSYEKSRAFSAFSNELRRHNLSPTKWALLHGQAPADLGAFTFGQLLTAASGDATQLPHAQASRPDLRLV